MPSSGDPSIASVKGRLAGGRRARDRPAALSLGLGGLGPSSPLIILAFLIAADGLAAQAAFRLGTWLLAVLGGGGGSASHPIDLLLSSGALALPIGYYLLGVYSAHERAPIEQFPLRIKATCLLFGLLLVWGFSIRGLHWPEGAVVVPAFLVMLVLSPLAEDFVRGLLIRLGLWGVPAVVIGAGPLGQQVVRALQQMPELGLRPVAFFDDSHPEPDTAQQGVPVLGSIADSALYSDRIHTAIVTTPAAPQETIGAVTMRLGYRDIIVVPDLRDLPTLWVGARDFSGMIGLRMRRNLLLRRNRLLKQTLDYVLAVPLLALSLPIILGLALWIVLESNGSPFYFQLRPGKDGRPIKVWKLRTMYPDAASRLQRHLGKIPAARGGMGPLLQAFRRSARAAPGRHLPASGEPRRAAADPQRGPRRAQLGRPAPLPQLSPGSLRPRLPAPARQRGAGHHRTLAGLGPQRRRSRRAAGARHLLYSQLVDLDRRLHPLPDGRGRARRTRRPLIARLHRNQGSRERSSRTSHPLRPGSRHGGSTTKRGRLGGRRC